MGWKTTVLEQWKPTRVNERELKEQIKTILSKIKIPHTKVIVGGSGGKNTWLKGTQDVDIYVKFTYSAYKNKSDKLSDILHKYLKKWFNVTRIHGSRDYFQLKHNKRTFEIVPILNIRNHTQAVNTTDLSQLHVKYVKQHPKLADDIRLAKIFAKAHQVYGAESYIRGFSGYCLEVLVIRHKSFTKFMRAVSMWKKQQTIGKKTDVAKMNAAKKMSPLILVDPVQPDRNVAAALSQEKYDALIKAAKQFVKQPHEKHFVHKPLNLKQLAKQGTVLFYEIQPLAGKKDIVGAKVMKAALYMSSKITQAGFTLHAANWYFDEEYSYCYFVVDPKKLSATFKHPGPHKKNVVALKAFKKKYKIVKFANNKSYTVKKRPFTTLAPFIDALLKDPNIKKRVKQIKLQAIIEHTKR